jgi:predicted nucleotidyltransferase
VTETDRQQILAKACAVLAARLPSAWAIYAYGSVARGDEGPASDLDLAVLLPPGQTIPDRLALTAEVARQVGRDVDIVDLRQANLDLVHELLRDGRQLRVTRADDVLGWEAERMSDYADFNPRRAEILAAYLDEPLLVHK